MEEKHIRFKPVESDQDAVYNKIQQRINKDKIVVPIISPVWKYTAIAASIALLIISSLFFYHLNQAMDIPDVHVIATAGTKTHITLPDSTSVWLNGNARISYPQMFTGKNRTVNFSGEGFFEVEKEKDKPFIVNVEGLQVKVLGTSFNIYTQPDSDLVEVTLTEGNVGLFKENNTSMVADELLSPGQQAIYNKQNGQFSIHNVRSDLYLSWITNLFYFDNNSLDEIMVLLGRAFNTHITIEGEKLRNTRLTAQFTHHETLDEILSILQTPAKYKYKKVEGKIYISDK